MKITYFKISGYAGIFTGLGLHELEIDLSKSIHKIVVISGSNGCGKSTLLQTLNVLPDDSSCFMDGIPAQKKIKIQDDCHSYEITIDSGKKFTTKCSIKKDDIELNPNGNVTSYKEIIFNEFDLDPNYISLSRISNDNRGLADMSPSERKKFMSFIIDTLGSYNDMYKILNKKSSIFKSHVNTLHTKIQNIGDEENIKNTMSILIKKRDDAKNLIDGIKASIIQSRTIININDNETGYIEQRYSELNSDINALEESLKDKTKELTALYSDNFIHRNNETTCDSYIMNRINEAKKERDNYVILKSDTEKVKAGLIVERESILTRMNDANRKIDNLKKDISPNLKRALDALNDKVDTEYLTLCNLDINPETASEDEYRSLINTITNVVDIVTSELYNDMTTFDLDKLLTVDSKEYLKEAIDKRNSMQEKIDSIKKDLGSLYNDRDTIAILDNRPKECSIDSCYFLGNACKVKCKYINKSLDEIINQANEELKKYSHELRLAEDEVKNAQKIYEKDAVLQKVLSICRSSNIILNKYRIGKKFCKDLNKNIRRGLSFNDYKNTDEINSALITISLYKKDKKSLDELNASLKAQLNSENMISQLQKDIIYFEDSLTRIDHQLKQTKITCDTHDKNITRSNNSIEKLLNLLEALQDYDKTKLKLAEKKKELQEIVDKSQCNMELINRITSWESQLSTLEPELSKLESQISSVSNQLIMLESYKNEFSIYQDKYNMIEVLKKYCSPSSGIQTLFIDLYMGKALDLANQVIDMVFNGKFKLLPFVISPTEFRIPFSANGLPVNDISFGSTSQICMMGMAINLVLLYQASTKYNIATLDEIDGGLDNSNRMKFIPSIYKISDILGIDQLFIISHSLELELNNVDRIILKTDDTEIPEGNILYNFNQSQH